MEQSDRAQLNWQLMELIVKYSKANLVEVAETKHYSTAFHIVESIIDSLTNNKQ